MKPIFRPLMIVALLMMLAVSCEKVDIPRGTPKFLISLIRQIQSEPVRNPPAEVYEWIYNGKKYYFITSYCCDVMSDLYDENGNIVCHPDGGFTGNGDGKCPDFSIGTLTKKLLWKDGRK